MLSIFNLPVISNEACVPPCPSRQRAQEVAYVSLHDCDDPHRIIFVGENLGKKRFETTRFDRATRKGEREWFWPGKFRLGDVSVIEGGFGSGKTWVAFDLALRTGKALAWPDGAANALPAADVLVVSRQDETDRISEYFSAPGDRQVYCFSGFIAVDEGDAEGVRTQERPVAFPADLEALDLHLEMKSTVGMVIIDNLADFCATPRQVSETLLRLNRMAQRQNIVILVTLPANCRTDAEGRLRVTSRWPTESARSSWCILQNPDDPDQRLLVCKRTNFGREPHGLSFRIGDSGVEWDAQSAIDPLDPLGRIRAIDGFLEEQLAEGNIQAKAILNDGAVLGFNESQLRAGGRRLGLTSARVGFGQDGRWIWKYAEKSLGGESIGGPVGGGVNLAKDRPAALENDRLEFAQGWDSATRTDQDASEKGIARRDASLAAGQALVQRNGNTELVTQKSGYEEIQPILAPGEVLVRREDGELYISRAVVEQYTEEGAPTGVS